MAADFHYPSIVVTVQGTAEPLPQNTGGVLRPLGGGAAVQVYDLSGSPIPEVRLGNFGVCQEFRADIPDGQLDFGSRQLLHESLEARRAGLAAQESTAAAQAAAEASAAASLGKADANHSHGPSSLQGSGTRDSTTFYRGDGVWAVPPSSIGGGGNVEGVGITRIEKITQTAYDALSTKDPNTAYFRVQG